MHFRPFLHSILIIFISLCVVSGAESPKSVEITKSFANIYEKLDPQSPVLAQAAKSQRYELVYEGEAWFKVKVKDKEGWLEKSAAVVKDKPATTIFSIPVGTFSFFILLLVAAVVGAIFMIYRQKTAEI